MNKYELINKDSSYSGMYRVKVFENEGNIRVYIPGISQINPFDSNGNLIEDIVNQNISAFPIAQWCAYNLESCDLANISEPMWCMFEGGDVKRPVIISYTFPKVVIEVTVYVGGSGGGVSDGGEYTSSGTSENDNYNYIFNKLIEMGATVAGAYGVLANIEAESAFSTALNSGDNGLASGICQWHPDRFSNLENYCIKNGLSSTSIEGQTSFMINEIQNGYSDLWDLICSANGQQGAYNVAYKMCYDFERPKNKEQKSNDRGNSAKNKYYSDYKN